MNVKIRAVFSGDQTEDGIPATFEQLWPLDAIPTVGTEVRLAHKKGIYVLYVREVVWDFTDPRQPSVEVYVIPNPKTA
jgi:hypothetical protein